jgi:5'-3' exonuclease
MKKTVGTKLDSDSIKLFEEKVKKEGKNKNQILKELITKYISENTTDINQVNQNNTQLSKEIATDSKKSQESQIDITQESQVNLKKSKFTNKIATDNQKPQQLQETLKSEPQKTHKYQLRITIKITKIAN